MIENGYIIPFKEVTKKDIYVFFKPFWRQIKNIEGSKQ